MNNFRNLIVSAALIGILAACTPETGFELHERTIFYVATTGNDSNVCTEPSAPCLTINGAIAKADDDDQINVAAGTYNEVTGISGGNVVRLNFTISIRGDGPGRTIIDAGGENGGLYILEDASVIVESLTIQNSHGSAPGSCVEIRDSAIVTLENVEITNCFPAGITNSSTGLVTLTNISVSQAIAETTPTGGLSFGTGVVNHGEMQINNGTIGGNGGSGVINSGTLTMLGSVVQNNNREGILLIAGEADLGGVLVDNNGLDGSYVPGLRIIRGAAATVTGSIFIDNPEGIHVSDAGSSLILENSTVRENRLTGIFVEGGEGQLNNVDVTENGTVGIGSGITSGISNEAVLAIRNSHIFQNLNGGVRNDSSGLINIFETTVDQNHSGPPAVLNLGEAHIENSLIANNFVENVDVSPAALRNDGGMTLLNTTISGNSHDGIHAAFGNLSINYVTITDNGGNGITAQEGGDVIGLIANTLVVRNSRDCSFGSEWPVPSMSGVNIDTDSTCAFVGTYADADLHLDSIADNGGPTLTHALLPGSPALDTATGACPPGDQRLFFRPFGPACDVGAYEAGGEALSLEIELPTATALSTEIIVTIIEDARCRTGPGLVYPDFDFFEPGQTTIVKGRSTDSNWYYVEAISYAGNCWIGKAVLQFDVSADVLLALPIINPPPTPTPTLDPDESYDPSPTPKPTACPTLANNPGKCK